MAELWANSDEAGKAVEIGLEAAGAVQLVKASAKLVATAVPGSVGAAPVSAHPNLGDESGAADNKTVFSTSGSVALAEGGTVLMTS